MGHDSTVSIYLGEDDDDDALFFAIVLKEIRPAHRLTRFENGLQLLERLLITDEQEPILVFLDLGMPVMHGLETLCQIRQMPHLQRLPVLILSGSESEQDIHQAYQFGCNGYLTKPTSMTELTRLIEPAIAYCLKILN